MSRNVKSNKKSDGEDRQPKPHTSQIDNRLFDLQNKQTSGSNLPMKWLFSVSPSNRYCYRMLLNSGIVAGGIEM